MHVFLEEWSVHNGHSHCAAKKLINKIADLTIYSRRKQVRVKIRPGITATQYSSSFGNITPNVSPWQYCSKVQSGVLQVCVCSQMHHVTQSGHHKSAPTLKFHANTSPPPGTRYFAASTLSVRRSKLAHYKFFSSASKYAQHEKNVNKYLAAPSKKITQHKI